VHRQTTGELVDHVSLEEQAIVRTTAR
jgi:hypothetical protein